MLTKVAPLLAYILSYPVMLISLRRVEIGIIFFVTIIPVIAAMKKISEFPMGNNFADFLLIAMTMGWILNANRDNRKFFISSPINVIVIIIVVDSIINFINGSFSMPFSQEIHLIRLKAWKNYMILPLLYFIVANNLRGDKNIKIAILCISIAILGTDFNFYSTFRWIKEYHYSHDLRISGAFTSLGPNEMGIFYAMNAFLLIGIMYFVDEKKFKYFLIFISLVSFYPIIYSYSRTSYLCSLGGLLSIGILKDKKLLIILLIIVVFYKMILPNSVIERIDMTILNSDDAAYDQKVERSGFDIGGATIEVTGRKRLWELAMNYFKTNPIRGIGFDTFRHLEGKITHGLFHKILAEEGLIGILIHLSFLLTILRQSYTLFRTGKEKLHQGIGLGFFTSVIIFILGTTTGDTSMYYNLMAIFWFFMGIVAKLNYDNLTNAKASA